MKVKDIRVKLPDLNKYTDVVLRPEVFYYNLAIAISEMKISPEERERKIYESLKEKYEKG